MGCSNGKTSDAHPDSISTQSRPSISQSVSVRQNEHHKNMIPRREHSSFSHNVEVSKSSSHPESHHSTVGPPIVSGSLNEPTNSQSSPQSNPHAGNLRGHIRVSTGTDHSSSAMRREDSPTSKSHTRSTSSHSLSEPQKRYCAKPFVHTFLQAASDQQTQRAEPGQSQVRSRSLSDPNHQNYETPSPKKPRRRAHTNSGASSLHIAHISPRRCSYGCKHRWTGCTHKSPNLTPRSVSPIFTAISEKDTTVTAHIPHNAQSGWKMQEYPQTPQQKRSSEPFYPPQRVHRVMPQRSRTGPASLNPGWATPPTLKPWKCECECDCECHQEQSKRSSENGSASALDAHDSDFEYDQYDGPPTLSDSPSRRSLTTLQVLQEMRTAHVEGFQESFEEGEIYEHERPNYYHNVVSAH